MYSTTRDKENDAGNANRNGGGRMNAAGGTSIDHHVKIVVVGDGGTGKTCMLVTYATGKYPTTYVPTVFENYLTNVRASSGKMIELAIWDTAGQEDYDRLRPLSYPDTNVLLVCFSVDLPVSLENIVEKWIPEITLYCPGVPFILVGLKTDLRSDSETKARLARRGQHVVTAEEGKSCAKKIGAYKYMECSAKNRVGLADIFNTAMSVVINRPKLKHRIMSTASSTIASRSSTSTNNTITNQASPSQNNNNNGGPYNPYRASPSSRLGGTGANSRLTDKIKSKRPGASGRSSAQSSYSDPYHVNGLSRRKKKKLCIIL